MKRTIRTGLGKGTIEDRYSGEVYSEGIEATQKKKSGDEIIKQPRWIFNHNFQEDTKFTEEKMAEKGEQFR